MAAWEIILIVVVALVALLFIGGYVGNARLCAQRERRLRAHIPAADQALGHAPGRERGRVPAAPPGALPALGAVAEVGRDHQLAPAAHLHPDQALVPPGDDPALAERQVEGLAGVPGGVELLAGRPRDAHVVDAQGVPVLGRRALADDEVLG